MYLLDTMILSEMRKRRGDINVLNWIRDRRGDALFVSTVTIGEIERGVERQRGINPAFAEALSSWLDDLVDAFANRVLPVDVSIARRWGQLTIRIGHAGNDLLIAATALEHGLIVATRNVRHFAPTGVAVENPFGDTP